MSYVTSFVGSNEGGVNVRMYKYMKNYKPGQRIRFSLYSRMKLKSINYCWGDGEKYRVKHFMGRSWFCVQVPVYCGSLPLLRVFTAVVGSYGVWEHEHTFRVYNENLC